MKIVVNAKYGGFGLSDAAMRRIGEFKGLTQSHQIGFTERSLSRDDPVLVAVVEDLREAADGENAELVVVEIPDGVDWEIEECEGVEWVSEKHRSWYPVRRRRLP